MNEIKITVHRYLSILLNIYLSGRPRPSRRLICSCRRRKKLKGWFIELAGSSPLKKLNRKKNEILPPLKNKRLMGICLIFQNVRARQEPTALTMKWKEVREKQLSLFHWSFAILLVWFIHQFYPQIGISAIFLHCTTFWMKFHPFWLFNWSHYSAILSTTKLCCNWCHVHSKSIRPV